MNEISLRQVFYIFKKRAWMIAVSTILALVLSAILSFFIIAPKYETFTTLMVGKPQEYDTNTSGIDYNDVLLNQKLVPTYGELVRSRLVADEVIRSLNLGISYDEFKEKVQVSLVDDTEIIKIQVIDKDRELAVKIANRVSEEFMWTVKVKMKVENIQIIDRAQLPQNPISPRKLLNMLVAAVFGFMIGIFLVFLLEYLDNTYKTANDIERNLQLPVLGAIPSISSMGKETMLKNDSKSSIAEAFRTMRTNIQFMNIDRYIKTLAVTSSTMGEGKSTVVANLAISFARDDKKVLIIDCDLRKPRIHKIFGIPNIQGLTNIIMGAKALEEVSYNLIGIKELSMIASGPIPPNPSELLGSKGMKEFLELAKGEYDIIIIDTPPVGIVTDAAIISTYTDATIFVIKAGETEIAHTEHAKELLDKVNANIIGAVLNNIDLKDCKYGGYQYTQYYNYYGEDVSD